MVLALLQAALAPSVFVIVIDTILGVNNWEPVMEIKAIPFERLKGLVNLEIKIRKNLNYLLKFSYTYTCYSQLLGVLRGPS